MARIHRAVREKILTCRANHGHYPITALIVDAHGPAQQRAFWRGLWCLRHNAAKIPTDNSSARARRMIACASGASARQGRRRHGAGTDQGSLPGVRRAAGQRAGDRPVRTAACRGEHRPAARRRSLSRSPRATDRARAQTGQAWAEAVRTRKQLTRVIRTAAT